MTAANDTLTKLIHDPLFALPPLPPASPTPTTTDILYTENTLIIHTDGTHSHSFPERKRAHFGALIANDTFGHSIVPQDFAEPSHDPLFHSLVEDRQRYILRAGVYNDTFREKYGKSKEIIGSGAFGVVRLTIKKDQTRQAYAIKEFVLDSDSEETYGHYIKKATKEFTIGNLLNHINIVKTYDLMINSNNEYFQVMEYCESGDLFTHILKNGPLDETTSNCFMKQILNGVSYMHKMGIAHRDLKPENLLLKRDGTIKITDLGTCDSFLDARSDKIECIRKSRSVKGTHAYIPPEIYSSLSSFDPRKHDIWSCGIIYITMVYGRKLFTIARRDDHLYRDYLKCISDGSNFLPFENFPDPLAKETIYAMLNTNPKRRPTAKEILKSKWLSSVNCNHHH